jgi:hypothetical protein
MRGGSRNKSLTESKSQLIPVHEIGSTPASYTPQSTWPQRRSFYGTLTRTFFPIGGFHRSRRCRDQRVPRGGIRGRMPRRSPHGRVHGGPREELFDRGKSPAHRQSAILISLRGLPRTQHLKKLPLREHPNPQLLSLPQLRARLSAGNQIARLFRDASRNLRA